MIHPRIPALSTLGRMKNGGPCIRDSGDTGMNVKRDRGAWLSSWEIVPPILVALVAFRVGRHAFTISGSLDFGLAYRGGAVAWRTRGTEG